MTRIHGDKLYSAVIVAAGSGKRFGTYKQLLNIYGKNITEHVLDVFAECGACELILVTKRELFPHFEYLKNIFDIPVKIVEGGEERSHSVVKGVNKASFEYVLIHDVARPNIDCTLIKRVLSKLGKYQAVIPSVTIPDTIIQVKNGSIEKKLDRDKLKSVQTPQGFVKTVLLKAFEKVEKDGLVFTDESTMLLDVLGIKSVIVDGKRDNVKITYGEDLSMFKDYKVVMGYDIHRLKKGGVLKVGGVKVKEGISPLAHSDGDVVLHALTDALLSINGMDDIGTLFSDTDEKWRNADSSLLVKTVLKSLKGMEFVKVDITCLLEKIKLSPYRESIKQNVARLLQISPGRISFKAKTKEGVGEVGEGKAVEAYVVLTYKS